MARLAESAANDAAPPRTVGPDAFMGSAAPVAAGPAPSAAAQESIKWGMSESLAKLIDALDFAAERHSTQRRKDEAASPYINHPIAVMRVLAIEADIEDGDVLCAAVLHDTIEDTGTTAQELDRRFGARVASIVVALTDDKS